MLLFSDHSKELHRKGKKRKSPNFSWKILFVAALIIEMLLIISGDVELNPGPLQGMYIPP